MFYQSVISFLFPFIFIYSWLDKNVLCFLNLTHNTSADGFNDVWMFLN